MSEHKHPTEDSGIVTSNVGGGGWRAVGLRIGVSLVVAAVLVFGGWLAYRWVSQHHAPKPANSQDESHQELAAAKAALTKAKTKPQKAAAYQELGRTYSNVGNYNQAIAAYQQESQTDASRKAQALSGLYIAYAQAGQRQKAIDTLKELIAMMQSQAKTDPYAATNLAGLQNDLQRLESGESL